MSDNEPAQRMRRYSIGPVALVATDEAQELFEVPVSQATSLCRQRVDWIEAIG